MRVRWALEEADQPYDVRLVSFSAMKEPAHLALHPFGQIPTYEEGNLALFESGAIMLHIAERHAGLLPDEANARARAIAWMFAALNTVEPPIVEREQAPYVERDKTWYCEERLSFLDDRIRARLNDLSSRLGEANWLGGAFKPGDLLMVLVLRRLDGTGILEEYPNLSTCRAWRSKARIQARIRCPIGSFHRRINQLTSSHCHPAGTEAVNMKRAHLHDAIPIFIRG